jgi:acyl-coenzyme A synthetase/AMP-(fatty) acid ligase
MHTTEHRQFTKACLVACCSLLKSPSAPTIVRAQVLGTVGEPINPEAWHWYKDVVGGGRSPIIDTWWQTETGGHMLTPLPGAWPEKPGSCSLPFFGAAPVLLDPECGKELTGAAEGVLCFKQVRASAVIGCS